jgi:hypothetical protein
MIKGLLTKKGKEIKIILMILISIITIYNIINYKLYNIFTSNLSPQHNILLKSIGVIIPIILVGIYFYFLENKNKTITQSIGFIIILFGLVTSVAFFSDFSAIDGFKYSWYKAQIISLLQIIFKIIVGIILLLGFYLNLKK